MHSPTPHRTLGPWHFRPQFSRATRRSINGKCLPLLTLLPPVTYVSMSSQLLPVDPRIVPHCFRASEHPASIAHSEPTSGSESEHASIVGRLDIKSAKWSAFIQPSSKAPLSKLCLFHLERVAAGRVRPSPNLNNRIAPPSSLPGGPFALDSFRDTIAAPLPLGRAAFPSPNCAFSIWRGWPQAG
jgi:hypothetical protein